jgi:hypothetical protein
VFRHFGAIRMDCRVSEGNGSFKGLRLVLEPKYDAITFYDGDHWIYYIPLDRCRSEAEARDWIRQISEKTWSSKRLLSDLCKLMLRILWRGNA